MKFFKRKSIIFPEGKKFAFSIFDDSDGATVEKIRPVYELLAALKIYTTKSVFVLPVAKLEIQENQEQTLSDPAYASFILGLRDKGFEIGFHGARSGSSKRNEIITALEHFRRIIGYYPRTYANHLNNKESIYWGSERLDCPSLRFLYKALTFKRKQDFCGHIPTSEYFWGDIAQKYITYTRNFTFYDVNTFKTNPSMPYYDPRRPYVNLWFSSSDGHDVKAFNRLLNPKNIDRLEREGGVCIVYTHFANGFAENGAIDSNTKQLLIDLSKREGWFVPVSTVLDFLKNQHSSNIIPLAEKIKMEHRWFLSKIIHGTS